MFARRLGAQHRPPDLFVRDMPIQTFSLHELDRKRVCELLDREPEHAKSEMAERARGLELQIAKLEAAISALALPLVTERRRTIDLPNPLKNVN